MTEEELFQTNQKALALEKQGNLEEATKLFELVIENNFDGSSPYDRLRIIYGKSKDVENEIRVLNKAVYVFDQVVNKKRTDRDKKLQRYKDQLQKAINKKH